MRLIWRRVSVWIIFVGAGVLLAPSFHAAQQTPLNYAALFEKSEALIPMRDGVILRGEILLPGATLGRLR